MTSKEIADIKTKCLEIAQAASPTASTESILHNAKELFQWVSGE